MGEQLNELRNKAVDADTLLEEALSALREAAMAVNSLGLLVGDLQREAADVEFEPVSQEVKALLDGRLLQRTGYIASRTTETGRKLRDLAQAVRALREDCAALVAAAEEPAP